MISTACSGVGGLWRIARQAEYRNDINGLAVWLIGSPIGDTLRPPDGGALAG
jgi:hypothetical protein